MEKEITTTNQTTALADSLIVVQQLPIIKEQLHSIKAQAQESVKEALSLACTEETLKVVKERRAALNRDRKDLDARRMAVKKQIMQPFEDFDEVYKECVTDVYGPADEALKGKITDVEAGLKADKEKKVKDSITVWIRWTALTGMLGTGKTSSGPSQLAVISMRMTTGRGAAVPKLYRFAG